MAKSADAFRTISEVADWLGVPAHVLRFWESKFSQVKPVKRAGGRRYYRPADMRLLGGIRKLLHDDGMTIKGVQKLLREQGIKHVAAQSLPLDTDDDTIEIPATEPAAPETAKVLSFSRDGGEDASSEESAPAQPSRDSGAAVPEVPEPQGAAEGTSPADMAEAAPVDAPAATTAEAPPPAQTPEVQSPEMTPPTTSAPATTDSPTEADDAPQAAPMAETASADSAPQDAASEDSNADTAPATETPPETPSDAAEPAPERPAAPRPRPITLPDDPVDTIAADPGPLSALSTLDRAQLAGQSSELSVLLDRVRRFPSTKANSRK